MCDSVPNERFEISPEAILERTLKGTIPLESELTMLCAKAQEIMQKEPNVLRVTTPLAIVGDIHGQYYDLLALLEIASKPPETKYLFLGDYVDRGPRSVETITLLLCYKILYPDRVLIIRGNHESVPINITYGFCQELSQKYQYPHRVHSIVSRVFDVMPLAAIINDCIFAVHGGLSPSITKIEQIDEIDRFSDVPAFGAFADLLWSDPGPQLRRSRYIHGSRGVGYLFSKTATQQFLEVNNMVHVLRAHQACEKGYSISFDDLVSTVWSAPNYCGTMNNAASVLLLNDNLERSFKVFYEAPQSAEDWKIMNSSAIIGEYFSYD